jgi:hypothetical protein
VHTRFQFFLLNVLHKHFVNIRWVLHFWNLSKLFFSAYQHQFQEKKTISSHFRPEGIFQCHPSALTFEIKNLYLNLAIWSQFLRPAVVVDCSLTIGRCSLAVHTAHMTSSQMTHKGHIWPLIFLFCTVEVTVEIHRKLNKRIKPPPFKVSPTFSLG